MLEIADLRKSYRTPRETITPVCELSLTVSGGEFVALHGPSGCGKTTLLLVAGGLLQPDAGTVAVAGQDLYRLSPEARARFRAAHIGFVFQQFHLIPYLNVLDNVLASALAAPAANVRERALQLLARFGMQHRLEHVPGELSTGERQRTALARALLHQPKLLLADEPTGNLDVDNGETVLGYLADFAKEGGAVLLVTHDLRAADYAHRMLPLGKVAEKADTGIESAEIHT